MSTAAQQTDQWRIDRSGHVTASRLCDVLNVLKDGSDGAGRRDYKVQLVAEILSGQPCDNGYISPEMQRGIELEPIARAAYEIRTGEMVDQVPFIEHPSIPRSGCSCDGFVGGDGIVEIKAPKLATHIKYLLAGKVPAEYVPQMCWQLACTGRKWNDFVSYSPELPEHLQLFIVRMIADESAIKLAESKVCQFLAEVVDMTDRLERLRV